MNSLRFLFRLQSIDFEVGNYETIECVAFLIDLQQKKRVVGGFLFQLVAGRREGRESGEAIGGVCDSSSQMRGIGEVVRADCTRDARIRWFGSESVHHGDDKKAKSYAEREILRVKQLKYGNTGGGGGGCKHNNRRQMGRYFR